MTSIEIEITALSKNGNGVGFAKGLNEQLVAYEVPFTLPGDIVKAKVPSTQGIGHHMAYAESLSKTSALRTASRCKHFGACGGCRLQHTPYKAQTLHKEKLVRDCFERLLTPQVTIHPIMPSKSPWHYRTKMDYTFSRDHSGKSQLGLVKEGAKPEVFSVEECFLSPQWFMDAIICVKQWWEESKIPPHDPTRNTGVLRYLTLREGRRSGDRMVILTASNLVDFDGSMRQIEKFASRVKNGVEPYQKENRLSIFLKVHQAEEGSPSSHYDMLLYGPGFIRESLQVAREEGSFPTTFSFDIGPSSFFQPNPQQTELLYSRAIQMAEVSSTDVVYDLYCGAGTIGICLSKYVSQVIAIELSSESAAYAESNAKKNGCENLSVYSGAVRHVLKQLQEEGAPPPDLIVVNPPRSGLEKEAIKHLLALKAKKILYISCFPETQAANIEALMQGNYLLAALQPVDQFPQTNHVESLALLAQC